MNVKKDDCDIIVTANHGRSRFRFDAFLVLALAR